MHLHHHPPRARLARGAAVVLAAALWSLASGGPVVAAPPQDLPGEVTDLADVLTPDEERAVAAATADLAQETPFQLFVVYVDGFDAWENRAWADATATASGLGRDDILLAVAVEDRRFQVRVQHDNALTDAQLTRVEQDRIEPALREDDWAGAAVAAAAGYTAARAEPAEPVSGGATVLDLLIMLLVVVVGGLVLLSPVLVPVLVWWIRRRRRARLAAADLADVEDRSARALVAADEAITRAVQEHAFAEAQFGTATVEPFTAALDRARTRLAEAFRLRRLLDDDEPETPARRQEIARAVLAACTWIETSLRTQEGHADQLREVHARTPQDLADARVAVERTRSRIHAAERRWVVVRLQYAPTATADVPAALVEAEAATDQAASEVAAGFAALDGERQVAVARAREARASLARAAAVLDGLDRLAADLDGASAAIRTTVAEIDAGLAEAARLGPDDPAVQEASTAARRTRDQHRSAGPGDDPLQALTALRRADRELDLALERVGGTRVAHQHAVERLPRALADVDVLVGRARSAVDRGQAAVGAHARARLAEAERLAADGARLATDDPVAALTALRGAADLAERAAFQAARNVDTARMRAEGLDPVNAGDRQHRSRSGDHGSGSRDGGSASAGASRGGGGRF